MGKLIWRQYKKYEEGVNYLIFGFLTFLVNTVVYWLAARAMGADNDEPLLISLATLIAWVVAVLFAYWTNRTFVFKSAVADQSGRLKEFFGFIGARVATGVLDQIIILSLTYYLDVNDVVSKMVGNVFVIISNYFLSKLLIFKKTDKS